MIPLHAELTTGSGSSMSLLIGIRLMPLPTRRLMPWRQASSGEVA